MVCCDWWLFGNRESDNQLLKVCHNVSALLHCRVNSFMGWNQESYWILCFTRSECSIFTPTSDQCLWFKGCNCNKALGMTCFLWFLENSNCLSSWWRGTWSFDKKVIFSTECLLPCIVHLSLDRLDCQKSMVPSWPNDCSQSPISFHATLDDIFPGRFCMMLKLLKLFHASLSSL